VSPVTPPSSGADPLLSRLPDAALDALAQQLPPASAAADAVEVEPAPWVSLTRAQCVLLAIALHRVSRARAGGERAP
jgi:hypothetical protein